MNILEKGTKVLVELTVVSHIKSANCGLMYMLNADVHPLYSSKVQQICIPCEKIIPQDTIFHNKKNKIKIGGPMMRGVKRDEI